MLIESIIKRPGGSEVSLGDALYLFAPTSNQDDAPHVGEVSDAGHIATLLAIKEGYRELGKEAEQEVLALEPVEEVLNPNALTNRDLLAWAREHGIIEQSRESIEEYAKRFGMAIDKRKAIPTLLREVMAATLDAEHPASVDPTAQATAGEA
jgi:hypothetical protein